jgi:hypothetical protein
MMRPAELGLKIDNVMGIYADTMPEHSKGYRGDEVKCRINHVLTNELTSSGAEAAALQRQFIAARISTLRDRAARLRRERAERAERAAAAAPLSGTVESARRDRHLAMNYRRAEVGSELARKLRKEQLADEEQASDEKTSGSRRPAARCARKENGELRQAINPAPRDPPPAPLPAQPPRSASEENGERQSPRSPLNSPPAPLPAQPPVPHAQPQAEPPAVCGAGGCPGSPPDGQDAGGLGLSPGSPAGGCAGPGPDRAGEPSCPEHDRPPAAEPPPATPATDRTDVADRPGGLAGGVVPALLLLLLLPLSAGPGRARAPEPPPVRTRALTAAAQAAGRAADRAAVSPPQGRRRVGRGPTRRVEARRQRHGVRWASSRVAAFDPSDVPGAAGLGRSLALPGRALPSRDRVGEGEAPAEPAFPDAWRLPALGAWGRSPQGQTPDAPPQQPAATGASPAPGRLIPSHPRQNESHGKPLGAWGRSPQGQTPDAPPQQPAATGASPALGRLIPSHPGQRASLRNPHGQGVRPASHGSDSSLIPHPSSLRSCRIEPELGASRVAPGSSSSAIVKASGIGLRPRDSPGLRGPPSAPP